MYDLVGSGFLVAEEDDGTVQNKFAINQFVEVVGVVVQEEHVVESSLEGEVMEEVMVEEVVEDVGEKEMVVVVAM